MLSELGSEETVCHLLKENKPFADWKFSIYGFSFCFGTRSFLIHERYPLEEERLKEVGSYSSSSLLLHILFSFWVRSGYSDVFGNSRSLEGLGNWRIEKCVEEHFSKRSGVTLQ